MERIAESYQDNVARFDRVLGVDRSCDVVNRNYMIGGKRARIWVIDGYGKDETLERMGAFWLTLTQQQTAHVLQVSQVQVSRLERKGLAHLREKLQDS